MGVTLRFADQGGTRDLRDGGKDVTGDECPDDRPSTKPQRAQVLAQGADERGERRVYGGGEKYGRDDDEEVLDHEVYHVVGVADGGRGGAQAECIANDFAKGSEKAKGGECPQAMQVKADRMEGEG